MTTELTIIQDFHNNIYTMRRNSMLLKDLEAAERIREVIADLEVEINRLEDGNRA